MDNMHGRTIVLGLVYGKDLMVEKLFASVDAMMIKLPLIHLSVIQTYNHYIYKQALSKITSTGAMTFCFIQAIERGHGATYGSILTAMRTAIRDVGSGGGGGDVVTSLLTMLVTGGSLSAGGLRQEPQLTACEAFDVYRKPFSL
ncbi:Metacaspase type I [Vigna unguiculata]|uniref:Metacaspase type I n=1 Tax=Vigna unguiculata TaxID=3917 RepID=A0A4D6NCZ8_VIGUN|nr:Metacaspase type I [Vigna unguiculata]